MHPFVGWRDPVHIIASWTQFSDDDIAAVLIFQFEFNQIPYSNWIGGGDIVYFKFALQSCLVKTIVISLQDIPAAGGLINDSFQNIQLLT